MNKNGYSCTYQGPWYECLGPNSEDVRLDLYNNFTWYNVENLPNCFTGSNIIKNIIFKVVPDNRHDFGSHRGYATFTRHELYKEVDRELKEYMVNHMLEKRAWKKLKTHLVPLIIHKLYKPGGLRFKNCKAEFNNLSNK